MTLALTRFRLDGIGPPGARFDPLPVDLRAGGDPAATAVLFLENGGGKSVLLRLLFSVVLPGRRQTVGSVKLDGYVGSNDTGHVAMEWATPEGPLVTGTVLEWRNRTRSASSSNLVQFWYAFTPTADILTLDLLPTRDGDRRVTRAGFRERLGSLAKEHPELDVTVEDSPARWSDHLTRSTPLDPETFRYQRQMNADEADAESLFAGVRTDDDFVRFVVEAAHDPEQLDGFDELLSTYAGQLARRQELDLEAQFYRRAGEVLRPLGAAYAGLASSRAEVATARRSAGRLRARLEAGVSHAAGLARARATEATTATERADALDREAGELAAVVAELRKREAAFRHAAAVAAEKAAGVAARAASGQVAAWEAVGAVADVRRLSGELGGLRAAQESAERELEPLRRAAERAAARWAGRLLAEAEALDAEASEADGEAARATTLAGGQAERRGAADRRGGEAAADARSLRQRATEVDAALAAATADGLVVASEPLADAVRRAARAAEDAAEALVTLRSRRREVEAERRSLGPAVAVRRGDEAGTEARLAAGRAELDGHHRAAAAIVGHPRTQALAPDATDAWVVLGRLEEVLGASVRSAEAGERAARAGIDDVDTRLDRLGVDGLLPAAPDVVRVADAVVAAGIGAVTGWSWLAQNRDEAGRAKALATNPALAGGVIVADPATLGAALDAVAEAAIETESVVLVGSADQLDRKAAGHAAPVRPALYDPGWTERTRVSLRAERDTLAERQDAALATLAEDVPLLDAVRDLRRRCPLTRRDELSDEVAALEARLAELRAALATSEQTAAGLAEALDVLDAEEPERQAARDTTAEASRRLRDLDERHRAAEAWRAEADAADRRGEALAAEAEAAGREADAERDRAESARARARRATADAAGRRAEARRASDAPASPDATLTSGELAGRADATREAYEAERSGRDLTPAIERVEATLAAREAQLSELADGVRGDAEDLAASPGADDPAVRRERVADARREAARRDDELARCRTALGAAQHTLDERTRAARRRLALDPSVEPADAESAARLAAEHEARAQAVLRDGRRARDTAADRSEQARNAEARAERLAAVMDVLPPPAAPGPDAGGATGPAAGGASDGGASDGGATEDAGGAHGTPSGDAAVLAWTAGPDEARQAARAARAGVDEAAKAVTAAERALDRTVAAVRAAGGDPAFAPVAGLRVALAGEGVESLADRASSLAGEADAMTASVEAELADTARHREGIVLRLATLVEAQLRQLRLLSRLSTLPAGLGEWSGKPFVSVGFEQVDGVELTARLGPVVDAAAATEARKRTGLDLLMAGLRAAVSRPAGEGEPDRTFTVRLLRPNRTMTYERASIGELEREFSGGMKLTAAICTYCALAALRANSRSTGSLFGVEPGPLFLDNPLGKASADYLLDLQHAIARRLGVQLVHTTGVWDVEALATYQRVVRLRNLADLRRNVRRLRVDDGVALPGTGPDTLGDASTGSRIDAVSFAVTPPA